MGGALYVEYDFSENTSKRFILGNGVDIYCKSSTIQRHSNLWIDAYSPTSVASLFLDFAYDLRCHTSR